MGDAKRGQGRAQAMKLKTLKPAPAPKLVVDNSENAKGG